MFFTSTEGSVDGELGEGPNDACGEQVEGIDCRGWVDAGGEEGIYGRGREEGVVGGDKAGGAVSKRETAEECGGPVEDKAHVRSHRGSQSGAA
jgi:hypothetical protein